MSTPFRAVRRLFALVLALLAVLACLVSCNPADAQDTPAALRDLVYSDDKAEGDYTVYLEEDGAAVPYLVLTDRYGREEGACLLLRLYLLEEPLPYNEDTGFAAYYSGSQIDTYLNEGFLSALSPQLQERILSTDLTITAKDSLGCCGTDTETISRKVFLLSAVEAGGVSSSTIPKEGEGLSYFRNDARRMAATADGTPGNWWLRTPNTWYDSVVCGVDRTGSIGIGGVGRLGEDGSEQNGVRPALCLDGDTPIVEEDGLYYLADAALP